MDKKALYKLTNGLYLISSGSDGTQNGCIINTLEQVTSAPEQLIAAVNKNNFTRELIEKYGCFSAAVLSEQTDMSLIAAFGFQSGRDADKFEGYDADTDKNGVKFLKDSMSARFSCKITDKLDLGSHILFIGRLEESEVLSDFPPMTYAYYQQIKKGTTPKNAPSYQDTEAASGWRCTVCGYVAKMPFLPEDFICPICGQPRSVFEKI